MKLLILTFILAVAVSALIIHYLSKKHSTQLYNEIVDILVKAEESVYTNDMYNAASTKDFKKMSVALENYKSWLNS